MKKIIFGLALLMGQTALAGVICQDKSKTIRLEILDQGDGGCSVSMNVGDYGSYKSKKCRVELTGGFSERVTADMVQDEKGSASEAGYKEFRLDSLIDAMGVYAEASFPNYRLWQFKDELNCRRN